MRSDQSAARAYWNDVAENYDQVLPETLIGRVQRAAIWRELEGLFRSGQRILELNCGTGIDAVYLASKGVRVLELAKRRATAAGVSSLIEYREPWRQQALPVQPA